MNLIRNFIYTSIIFFCIGFIAGGTIISWIVRRNNEAKYLRTIRWYEDHYHVRQGVTTLNGNLIDYHLVSIDDDQTWLVVKNDKVIGNAVNVYPGLLEHLAAWEAILAQAQKVGPLDPALPESQELFKKVGITVQPHAQH
jgi:hypothetical protein